MRAFFQELKTNRRRRTAPQRGGRRPIRFRRQAPALGRPHGIDHIRAPSTPSRGPITLFALPRPTGAGPAARGTRTQDPGPTSSNDHDPTRTKTFARNTAPTPDPTAPTPRPRSASTIDHTTSATTSRREARPHDAQARPLLHTSRTTGSGGGCTTCWRSVLCLGLGLIGVCIGMRWRGWWLVSRLRRWLGMWGAGVGR